MVARDLSLAELTGGHIHIAHASTTGTLNLIKAAKARGIRGTCEVTPHHLTLSETLVMGTIEDSFVPLPRNAYDTNAKVNPPLRNQNDVRSMVEGLQNGTIDVIATDHAPHNQVDKTTTFQDAAFGISVLETAFGSLMTLVENGHIDITTLIKKLTADPAKFLGMPIGSLEKGHNADITVFDPSETWIVSPQTFLSKGKNTPIGGSLLKGKIKATFFKGRKIY